MMRHHFHSIRLTAIGVLFLGCGLGWASTAAAQPYPGDWGSTYSRSYRGYDVSRPIVPYDLRDHRRSNESRLIVPYNYDDRRSDRARSGRAHDRDFDRRGYYGPPYATPPEMTYRQSYRPIYPPSSRAYRPSRRVLQLVDVLSSQANAFVQAFAPTAHVVPEGWDFLAEGQTLAAAAAQFRELAISGVDPGQLALELRSVEGIWGQLAARTDRVSRGRSGPNIENIFQMGETIAQLQQALSY